MVYPLIIWSAAPTTRKSTGRRAAQCAAPTAQPAQTGRVLDPPLRNPLRRSGLAVGAGPRTARGLGDREGRPYGKTETGSVLRRGGPWASRRRVCKPRGHPHPSGLRPATFPLQGGRLGGRPQGSPLRRKRAGSVSSVNPGAAVEPHLS